MATGLYYYGYRYYDSQSGRFTSLDRHRPNYLNPQSLNRYLYALDNPNRYFDPDGRFSQETEVTPDERAAIRAAVKDIVSGRGGSTGGAGPDTSPRDPYRGPPERIIMLKLMVMEYSSMAAMSTSSSTSRPPDYIMGSGASGTGDVTLVDPNFPNGSLGSLACSLNAAGQPTLFGQTGEQLVTQGSGLLSGGVGVDNPPLGTNPEYELVVGGVMLFGAGEFIVGKLMEWGYVCK